MPLPACLVIMATLATLAYSAPAPPQPQPRLQSWRHELRNIRNLYRQLRGPEAQAALILANAKTRAEMQLDVNDILSKNYLNADYLNKLIPRGELEDPLAKVARFRYHHGRYTYPLPLAASEDDTLKQEGQAESLEDQCKRHFSPAFCSSLYPTALPLTMEKAGSSSVNAALQNVLLDSEE